jgi:signal transduction histidine kinase
MSNAVAVANCKPASLTSVTLHVSTEDSMTIMRLADDGPGLPAGVRTRLVRVRSRRSAACRHGYGLTIAHERAERNGGTLTLVPSTTGFNPGYRLAKNPSPTNSRLSSSAVIDRSRNLLSPLVGVSRAIRPGGP